MISKGKKERAKQEINASSMADIAFLLLIFFLVTTTIASEKGITVVLPPHPDDAPETDVQINERNVFNILLNSKDMLLIENELGEIHMIKNMVKEFISNNGRNPKLSDSPKDAIISIKTDRGTSYEKYIAVQDEVRRAYNELRAAFLQMSLEDYLKLDEKNPEEKELLKKAKEAFPLQISDADASAPKKK
ncbi:MAG: biopolymer transporter ExbD [Cytophagales bacterium]|nr:biopolymer transporter ExbD [Cytophagales bacterium]MDW8383307.1 biopolymer transporter ExbD [Flammeovirgaceae bacterium]